VIVRALLAVALDGEFVPPGGELEVITNVRAGPGATVQRASSRPPDRTRTERGMRKAPPRRVTHPAEPEIL